MNDRQHVLIIEPDMLLGRTYDAALKAAGFGTCHVQSAQAAIDAVDAQMPNVIILEMQLPMHNGAEFLYELRSYAEWQHIPVIINSFMRVSALELVNNTLVQDLGVVAILYKPRTSLQQLVRATQAQAKVRL